MGWPGVGLGSADGVVVGLGVGVADAFRFWAAVFPALWMDRRSDNADRMSLSISPATALEQLAMAPERLLFSSAVIYSPKLLIVLLALSISPLALLMRLKRACWLC